MAKNTLKYNEGLDTTSSGMAACSTCTDPREDDNIPGPLGVKYDDHDYTIDVILAIRGVKRPGIFGMHRNTRVDAKFTERSLRILVEILPGKTSASREVAGKYLYKVKQLPDRIMPEHCTWELRKDRVVVSLRKAKIGSWKNSLDQHGLDTAVDE